MKLNQEKFVATLDKSLINLNIFFQKFSTAVRCISTQEKKAKVIFEFIVQNDGKANQ